MGASVTVLIPWQGSDPHRTAALGWVAKHLITGPLQGSPLMLSEVPEGEAWSKARAIGAAAGRIATEFVVVHDADVWSDGLPEALAAVRRGAPWAMPHARVHRLTPEATDAVLAGAPLAPDLPTVKRPYQGVGGGGVVVLHAEGLRQVLPDVRFTGWGGEDAAWRDALRCLLGGEWRQTRAPLYHLWHPPALDEYGDHRASPENGSLAARYRAARRDPAAMRALMAEAAA